MCARLQTHAWRPKEDVRHPARSLPLIPLRPGFSLYLELVSMPPLSSASVLTVLELQACIVVPGLGRGIADLKSGLHAWAAGTLTHQATSLLLIAGTKTLTLTSDNICSSYLRFKIFFHTFSPFFFFLLNFLEVLLLHCEPLDCSPVLISLLFSMSLSFSCFKL